MHKVAVCIKELQDLRYLLGPQSLEGYLVNHLRMNMICWNNSDNIVGDGSVATVPRIEQPDNFVAE